jgi:hypothetical protein
MRLNSALLLTSCLLLAACGDKTPNPADAKPAMNNAAVNPNAPPANTARPTISEAPAIAGSGCSDGSAKIEFQAQQDSFKLTLPSIEINEQRKNLTCNIAIPVTIPSGYQVSIIPLRFSGNLEGNGLQLELRREYFFAGSTGNPHINALALPSNNQFELQDAVNNEDNLQWSICGQDTNIRANTRVLFKGGAGQANITLSSTDPADPLLFKLNYRACQ